MIHQFNSFIKASAPKGKHGAKLPVLLIASRFFYKILLPVFKDLLEEIFSRYLCNFNKFYIPARPVWAGSVFSGAARKKRKEKVTKITFIL